MPARAAMTTSPTRKKPRRQRQTKLLRVPSGLRSDGCGARRRRRAARVVGGLGGTNRRSATGGARDGEDACQVVPGAGRAHLDDVAGESVAAPRQLAELVLRR